MQERSAAQPDALGTYDRALNDFKSSLSRRRAQINSNQQLPNLPGQELYLARNRMMSAYKDLTDAVAAKICRPNKYGIPPAYFDANNEPLLNEYYSLIGIMEAPLTNAQYSDTPLKDVVDLAIAIGRAKGSMRHMRMWQVASVWAFSLPRRLANRTRQFPLEYLQRKFSNRRA